MSIIDDVLGFHEGFIVGYQTGDASTGGNLSVLADSPGPMGDRGVQGPDGIQGIQGLQGYTGLTGYTGYQGLVGITGDQGEQGNQGIQGLQGNQGLQGDRGVTGIKGDQGIQGPPGIAQRLMTKIDYYADGFIVQYSNGTNSNCGYVKDAEGKVSSMTNFSISPNEVTNIGYNIGNRP